MDFRTKEGESANNWFTRSAYDTMSGEDWVLVKDDPDPRKRQWVKYDRNGKVVNRKTGALNIGGNLTQWGKGGLKNVGNTANAVGKFASAFDIRDRVKSEGNPPRDAYSTDLEYTMGFNPESPLLSESLVQAFTNNLDTFLDETDSTNLMALGEIYGVGFSDQVSAETGNKGNFWDKLSNSFDSPQPIEPSTPALTDADRKDIETDKWYEQNYEQMLKREPKAVEKGKTKVEEETPSQKRLRSAKDFDNKLKGGSTKKEKDQARDNWRDMTHYERTQAKAFARGNPLKEMKIRRAKSTFFDENK